MAVNVAHRLAEAESEAPQSARLVKDAGATCGGAVGAPSDTWAVPASGQAESEMRAAALRRLAHLEPQAMGIHDAIVRLAGLASAPDLAGRRCPRKLSVRIIARESGAHFRAVIRSLAFLENEGFLQRVRAGESKSGPKGFTAIFTVDYQSR